MTERAKIKELSTALEAAVAENMTLREVLAPFALFAKPAAIELAGGNKDHIGTVLLEHEHQSLSLGGFLMAREVWDELYSLEEAAKALEPPETKP